MHSLVKALWRRWTRVAHAIGTFQARLLLTALYGYPSYFGARPADFDAQAAQNQYYADVAANSISL